MSCTDERKRFPFTIGLNKFRKSDKVGIKFLASFISVDTTNPEIIIVPLSALTYDYDTICCFGHLVSRNTDTRTSCG